MNAKMETNLTMMGVLQIAKLKKDGSVQTFILLFARPYVKTELKRVKKSVIQDFKRMNVTAIAQSINKLLTD